MKILNQKIDIFYLLITMSLLFVINTVHPLPEPILFFPIVELLGAWGMGVYISFVIKIQYPNLYNIDDRTHPTRINVDRFKVIRNELSDLIGWFLTYGVWGLFYVIMLLSSTNKISITAWQAFIPVCILAVIKVYINVIDRFINARDISFTIIDGMPPERNWFMKFVFGEARQISA